MFHLRDWPDRKKRGRSKLGKATKGYGPMTGASTDTIDTTCLERGTHDGLRLKSRHDPPPFFLPRFWKAASVARGTGGLSKRAARNLREGPSGRSKLPVIHRHGFASEACGAELSCPNLEEGPICFMETWTARDGGIRGAWAPGGRDCCPGVHRGAMTTHHRRSCRPSPSTVSRGCVDRWISVEPFSVSHVDIVAGNGFGRGDLNPRWKGRCFGPDRGRSYRHRCRGVPFLCRQAAVTRQQYLAQALSQSPSGGA